MSAGAVAEAGKTHELKTWPPYFQPVLSGDKQFEVRPHDRDFHEGDTLILREWSDRDGTGYTGRELRARVTYLLPGGMFGIEDGYCVLSIALTPETALQRSTPESGSSPGGATDGQRQGDALVAFRTWAGGSMRRSEWVITRGEAALLFATWRGEVAALLARVEAADKRAAEYACKVLEQITELEDSQDRAEALGERVVALGTEGARLRRALEAARDFYNLCASEGISDYTADQGALASAYERLGEALAQSEGLPRAPLDTPAKEDAR